MVLHTIYSYNDKINLYNYNKKLLTFFINYLNKEGKKNNAINIYKDVLKQIHKQTNKNPYLVFFKAIKVITPLVELKTIKRRGSRKYLPVPIMKNSRKMFIAVKWLITSAKKQKGNDMATKIAKEVLQISKKQGYTLAKVKHEKTLALNGRPFLRVNKRKMKQLRSTGLEPVTNGLEDRRSIQLS